MPQKKIDVLFYIPDYIDQMGTTIRITRITPAQLKQLQESLAAATLPADACPNSISLRYEDTMSFLDGGARKTTIAGRRRILEISDLFYLTEYFKPCPACGKQKRTDEVSMTKYCARNLRAGRCRDEFMRRTVGAALFPQLYAKDKQK